MDKDGDGKVAGDEIQGPMKDNLESIDTDKDGSVSLDEFKVAMSKFRPGGGGAPGGGPTEGSGDATPKQP